MDCPAAGPSLWGSPASQCSGPGPACLALAPSSARAGASDISADQQWIALGGPDRILKIYHTKDGSLEHRIKKHTEWITAVEFSPDSKYLATGDRNGGLMLWEAATGQEMFNLPGHKGAITAITWRRPSVSQALRTSPSTARPTPLPTASGAT